MGPRARQISMSLAADFLSEEGKAIPYLFLSSSPAYASNSAKLQVYIQAAIHGNEPAADQGALALLGKMDANQTWTASLLETMDIKILPRYNVDGVAYFQRVLASNLDPNREHIKLDKQQSREIKKTFSNFSPHIAVDLHEFTAPSIYGGDYQHGSDAMISGGINPNIHPTIRSEVLDRFIPAMGSKLESYGLRWEPYVTGSTNTTSGSRIVFEEAVTEARTGRNAHGLTQAISFLLEMRGIRLANQHFQRRVATALLKLEAILETARDNHLEILNNVETARQELIESNEDIVVTDYYTLENRTFTMVDRNNGSIVQVPIDFYATTPSVANLTRSRPEAYLIPRTWSPVVERLQILGLEVQTLDYSYRGTVEALNITSSSLEGTIYEGHVLNSVTTEAMRKEVSLPAGSFLVSTRQKNAALTFIALEPENIDSYVTFGIVPVEVGDEYPIYRVLREEI
ncbi:Carboxypeptidase 2 [Pseudocercospora fuligena]|uniref:Carboxypeptidase 2 n=1 Tax=Pseudocercospora fuligena TaxID=685502 RepID=A0A8H6RBZ8_9PEZI|nr:Carboxypeptidase 2 [Pseudocercospora fuligena]